ncbi:MAG: hypothetical protein PHY62_00255 [Gallionella sp.]|nr:hypothetical protein [Gallionella sp.]
MGNSVDIVVVTVGGLDAAQSIADSPTSSTIAWSGFQAAINATPLIVKDATQLAGIGQISAGLTLIKIQVDMIDGKSPSLGDVISVVGAGITLTAAVAAAGTVAAPSVVLVSFASVVVATSALYANSQGYTTATLSDSISTLFTSAQTWTQPIRYDPLTLDLNGNGLDTVGISASNPILFDLTGSGIKTSVGWVAPSDGFLALDRNGNGLIDNGSELFGDATPLATGGQAADGFAALAQEDTNLDGLVNNADARYTALRVWQDHNQDGISQSNELKTLSSLGIQSFNVANITHSQQLANGNQLADLGTYTRTDGSVDGMGGTFEPTPCGCNGRSFYRLPCREAANEAVFEVGRRV